jgi:tetratricopeptide (TPR) repeat protein
MSNLFIWRSMIACAAFAALSAVAQAPRVVDPDAGRRDKNYYDPAAAPIVRSVELNHLGRAINQMHEKRWPGARADLEFILRYVANHPQALSLLSEVCFKVKEPDCAQPFFDNALRLYPETASTHAAYGAYLHRLGNVPQAIEAYKRALALNPKSTQTHYNLGLAYFDTKDYQRANEEAQRAYAMGAELPGLRDKLIRAKQWNPSAAGSAAASDPSGATKGTRSTVDAPGSAR